MTVIHSQSEGNDGDCPRIQNKYLQIEIEFRKRKKKLRDAPTSDCPATTVNSNTGIQTIHGIVNRIRTVLGYSLETASDKRAHRKSFLYPFAKCYLQKLQLF